MLHNILAMARAPKVVDAPSAMAMTAVKWCGQMAWSSGGQTRRIGGGVGASSAVTATGSARSNGGQIVPVTATGSARSNSGQIVPVTGTGSAHATWLSAAILLSPALSLSACNIALCV